MLLFSVIIGIAVIFAIIGHTGGGSMSHPNHNKYSRDDDLLQQPSTPPMFHHDDPGYDHQYDPSWDLSDMSPDGMGKDSSGFDEDI